MSDYFDQKSVIGNAEWCTFPSLNIPAIKARVDSGAKTSSLHAVNIQSFQRAGQLWVTFEVHPIQESRKVVVYCEAEVVDQRVIKSSSGDREKRYVIQVPLQLGERTWEVELTLTDRDSMGYRMLLGREAMNGRLLVDPQVSCIFG
ncbi:MAG: ATP-dependent zinc protease, partial [Marinomonas gallaica]